MVKNTLNEVFIFIFSLVLGVLLGLIIAKGSGTTKAYVQHNRVEIEIKEGPDLTLTRTLPPEEAHRIANAINAAIGREWNGLR